MECRMRPKNAEPHEPIHSIMSRTGSQTASVGYGQVDPRRPFWLLVYPRQNQNPLPEYESYCRYRHLSFIWPTSIFFTNDLPLDPVDGIGTCFWILDHESGFPLRQETKRSTLVRVYKSKICFGIVVLFSVCKEKKKTDAPFV